MVIAVDFDGTLVHQDRPYEDVTTPLVWIPGAREGLLALKRAGHTLILWSGRASLSLRKDPSLDPIRWRSLLRAHGSAGPALQDAIKRSTELNEARFQQMLAFFEAELPSGFFDAVDMGDRGKVSADMYIDDRALRFGVVDGGFDWPELTHAFGMSEDDVAKLSRRAG